jgi:hypothetical protein
MPNTPELNLDVLERSFLLLSFIDETRRRWICLLRLSSQDIRRY